MLRIKSKMYN